MNFSGQFFKVFEIIKFQSMISHLENIFDFTAADIIQCL